MEKIGDRGLTGVAEYALSNWFWSVWIQAKSVLKCWF